MASRFEIALTSLRQNPKRGFCVLPPVISRPLYLPPLPTELAAHVEEARWHATMTAVYFQLPRKWNCSRLFQIGIPFAIYKILQREMCRQYFAIPCLPNNIEIGRFLHREAVCYYRKRGINVVFTSPAVPLVVVWSLPRLARIERLRRHEGERNPTTPLPQPALVDLLARASARRRKALVQSPTLAPPRSSSPGSEFRPDYPLPALFSEHNPSEAMTTIPPHQQHPTMLVEPGGRQRVSLPMASYANGTIDSFMVPALELDRVSV